MQVKNRMKTELIDWKIKYSYNKYNMEVKERRKEKIMEKINEGDKYYEQISKH